MFHWTMGVVAVVAVVAIGTVDYKQKAESSGATLTTFSLSGYMDALKRQSETAKARKEQKEAVAQLTERQNAGTLMYLPEAPEGWTRRAWSAGDNSAIAKPPRDMSPEEQEIHTTIAKSPVAGMLASNADADTAKDKHSWVYSRGDDTVFVSAELVQPIRTDTLSGMAMGMLSNNMGFMTQQTGFAIVQGVAFAENSSFDNADDTGAYRSFSGYIGMGQEVQLRVRASNDTTEDAIREILGAVDYVGLNNLLAQPLAGVGPGAPELDPESQIALAEMAFDIRRKIKSREVKDIDEKMRNMDPMSMALKQIQTKGAVKQSAQDVNAKTLEYQRALDAMLKEAKTKKAAMASAPKPEETAEAETPGWKSKIADLAKSTGFSGGTDAAPTEPKAASKTTFTCTIDGGRKRCIANGE